MIRPVEGARIPLSTKCYLKNFIDDHSCHQQEVFLKPNFYDYIFKVISFLRIHVHLNNSVCLFIVLNAMGRIIL